MPDACVPIGGFLSRGERRRIRALAPAVGLATKGDARQHRVRIASRAEIETDAVLKSEPDISTAPGVQWVTIVKQLAPGVRLRVVERSIGRDPADFDVGQEMASSAHNERVVGGIHAYRIEGHMHAALARMVGVRP